MVYLGKHIMLLNEGEVRGGGGGGRGEEGEGEGEGRIKLYYQS